MRTFLSLICLAGVISLNAGTGNPQAQNIFIVTIDGIRWQELFQGANETILNDGAYVNNKEIIRSMYWDTDTLVRRKKLMPFFWDIIAGKGQIYGNRVYGNNMDVTNNYKFSYPGYNEIFTGYPDTKFVPNTPVLNRNTNVLEFLNKQDHYHNSVVAFTSWNVFPFILNEARSKIPVNSGYEPVDEIDSQSVFINKIQQSFPKEHNTRLDELTFVSTMNYVQAQHPKVTLLSFGEADEFAHHGHYDKYLQSMNQIDRMIAELWYYIQTDEFYKDNTTIIITTDHGRGFRTNTWTDHLFFVKGSKEIWMAVMGPDILPLGELKTKQTIYQKQLAATIANLLGYEFTSDHKIGKRLELPMKDPDGAESGDVLVMQKQ